MHQVSAFKTCTPHSFAKIGEFSTSADDARNKLAPHVRHACASTKFFHPITCALKVIIQGYTEVVSIKADDSTINSRSCHLVQTLNSLAKTHHHLLSKLLAARTTFRNAAGYPPPCDVPT